jgi:hypothetical protein
VSGSITHLIELGIDATNAELLEQSRLAKTMREAGASHVVCCVRGFDEDPRELWDIPEVRAFCRRLVAQGFISYLDLATRLPGTPAILRDAMGALEVWLTAEAKLSLEPMTLGPDVVERFRTALDAANALMDAALGPFQRAAQ